MIGRAESAADLLVQSPLTSLPSVCYERNHFFCRPPSVPQLAVFHSGRRWSHMKNVLQRGTWRCEIADSSLPSALCLRRYFFFYWQSGWISGWWLLLLLHRVLLQPWLLLFPGHLLSIAATFPISQGSLYEDRKLRGNVHKAANKRNTWRSSQCHAHRSWCNFIKWIIK